MTIVHREGNINKNSDGLSRWALPTNYDKPAYDADDIERDLPILVIHVSELEEQFLENLRLNYNKDHNIIILLELLSSDHKNAGLAEKLSKPWEKDYLQGRFCLLDGLLYHRTRHSCVVVLVDNEDIENILLECHDSVYSGNFSLDRTTEKIKNIAWWPIWKKDVEAYCSSCNRCQKANRDTGKRYGLLQKIDEPKNRWEVINMDFVTGLPPGGKDNVNSVLVILDRFSKRAKFLSCHKEDTAMDVAFLFWNKIISDVGCPRVIITDRDPKFTSKFWGNLYDI